MTLPTLLAAWTLPLAYAQDTLTARIVPSHPRPGEPVMVELVYEHAGAESVRVPADALGVVTVTGALYLKGGEAEALVALTPPPSAPIPAVDLPWTTLTPGETLRRVLPLGDAVTRCAPGCPAGEYNLLLSLTPPAVSGAEADQRVPAPPPVALRFEVVGEALGVEGVEALRAELRRARVGPDEMTARVTVTNVSARPLRVPAEDGAVLASCSLWWRDEAGEEAGSMSTVGVGGQRTLNEATTVVLAPGASWTYDVACGVGAPGGVTLIERSVTLRPIAPFVPSRGPYDGAALYWTGSLTARWPR